MQDNVGRRRVGPPEIEWPTISLIAGCYGIWALAGIWMWPQWPVAALVVMTIMVAMQSSLMHECLHGHPTRNARLNEALVGLPMGLVYPYRRFKALHLRHHADERLTDPFEDPESYYRANWQVETLPRAIHLLLRVNNTMLGRIVIGPLLADAAFFAADWKLVSEGDRSVRKAWMVHAGGLLVVVPLVSWGFSIPLWLYILVPVWLGQSLIAIRTFAEHQWSERPDGRTIIVERSPLALLFLNNNLHLVHHKMPTIPWYRLPQVFRSRREEWLRMNGGYAYGNYAALLREFAFKPKEPLAHPVLRRLPEAGRAFRPRMRGSRSLAGGGSVPVPAKPPQE